MSKTTVSTASIASSIVNIPVTVPTVAVKVQSETPLTKDIPTVLTPHHAHSSHNLVRLGLELGLAVNDYNSGLFDTLDEVNKLTLAYLAAVKMAIEDKLIEGKEIRNYFALVGQCWGSVVGRFDNEYLEELND